MPGGEQEDPGYHQVSRGWKEPARPVPRSGVSQSISNLIQSIIDSFSANLSLIFQLEKAEDGFSIIAEYFGRGLFSQPTPLPDIRKAPPQKRQVSKCLHIHRCIHLKRKTYVELTFGTS